MNNTNTLENEYNRCLDKITTASEYITNMALDRDVDKIDLYRSYLNEMVDRAVGLKKLLNK